MYPISDNGDIRNSLHTKGFRLLCSLSALRHFSCKSLPAFVILSRQEGNEYSSKVNAFTKGYCMLSKINCQEKDGFFAKFINKYPPIRVFLFRRIFTPILNKKTLFFDVCTNFASKLTIFFKIFLDIDARLLYYRKTVALKIYIIYIIGRQ